MVDVNVPPVFVLYNKSQNMELQCARSAANANQYALLFGGSALPISQIKSQFVNAVDAVSKKLKKPLLKVTSVDDAAHLFQFPDVATRDAYADALKTLINHHRIYATSSVPISQPSNAPKLTLEEIKLRQAMLQKEPRLRKLHRDLVIAGYVSEEEFWRTRKHLLQQYKEEMNQQVGLSTELLHQVKPVSSSEGNDVKFTLTKSIIESIFVHHPAVKRAFDQNVPGKLTEMQFWERCFESAFFYREATTKRKPDTIFDKAIQEETEEMASPAHRPKLSNFLTDLQSTEDSGKFEDNGNAPDVTMRAGSNAASVPIIKRLNRHGELVVQSYHGIGESSEDRTQTSSTPRHKQVLRSVMNMDDLEPMKPDPVVPLHIANQALYFQSGKSTTELFQNDSMQVDGDCTTEKLLASLGQNKTKFTHRNPTSASVCAEAAVQISKKITSQTQNATDSYLGIFSTDTFQDIQTLHENCVEILHHYWTVPLNDPDSHEVKKKLAETLRQQRTKIGSYLNGVEFDKNGKAASRIFQSLISSLEKVS